MTDLMTRPARDNGKQKAVELMGKLKTFSDVEKYLLRGRGLSPATYRTYAVSVRQLCDFTGRKSPFEIEPVDIESFYHYSLETLKVTHVTALNKINALKRYFRNVKEELPGYQSPFELMAADLLSTLTTRPKTGKQAALSMKEINALIDRLEADPSVNGKCNHALVLFFFSSGLRAAEVCGLRFRDIERDPDTGKYYARGIGKGKKGGKPFLQEIVDEKAVPAIIEAFRALHGREPRPDDLIFWALPRYHGDTPRPFSPHAAWFRVNTIFNQAKEAGIISDRQFKVGPHLFRRTIATTLHAAGMPIVGIQDFLRHENIATTVKYIDSTEPAGDYYAKIRNQNRQEVKA